MCKVIIVLCVYVYVCVLICMHVWTMALMCDPTPYYSLSPSSPHSILPLPSPTSSLLPYHFLPALLPLSFPSSPYSVVGMEGQTGASSLSLPVQATLPPQSPYLSYNSFTIPQSPTFLQPSQFQQGTAGGGSSHFMQMAAATPSPLYPLYPVQQQQQ